jgi:hypothetical protein
MSEEEKKITEAEPEPREKEKQVPHSYYYDDSTGYEVYTPAPDEDELDE